MIIEYYNYCYERTLIVRVPNLTELEKEDAWHIIDDTYDIWNSIEKINDRNYQEYVQNSCLEEFEIENLNKKFSEWEEWWVVEDKDIIKNKGDMVNYDA